MTDGFLVFPAEGSGGAGSKTGERKQYNTALSYNGSKNEFVKVFTIQDDITHAIVSVNINITSWGWKMENMIHSSNTVVNSTTPNPAILSDTALHLITSTDPYAGTSHIDGKLQGNDVLLNYNEGYSIEGILNIFIEW